MDSPLSRLEKRADSVAVTASALVRSAMRSVRVELAELAKELNLAGSASARDKAYEFVRKRCAILSKRLDRLMASANELAGKTAAKAASEMTGLEVKYSKKRAEAVTELVTPAQGENLAAVFTDRMAKGLIDSLRSATVAALRANAVAGGTMKEMRRDLELRWRAAAKEEPVFTDAAGRRWDAGAYLQMNVRTNAMRVYNDCLADDVARATGSDLMRVSRGGDPNCAACSPWEGAIVSLTGKTEGLPTYEQAREAGCFHPNCVHTLECVDETADADEIALQRKFPVTKETAADRDAADERKYEIDQRRYRDGGMTADEAREAVDRDNLTASIRHGLLRADARKLVDAMTPAQVAAMCPNGNPPRFEPFKPTKKELREGAKETWRRGRRGGVVHVAKDATVERLLEVCGIGAEEEAGWRPTTALEKATDALMAEIGAKHVDGELGLSGCNPEYQLSKDAEKVPYTKEDAMKRDAARAELKRRGLRTDAFTSNCQRCVPTWEARKRGYPVTALPYDAGKNGNDLSWGTYTTSMWKSEDRIAMNGKHLRQDIEKKMAKWGDGARCEVRVAWQGANGSGHVFVAEQSSGKTVFIDPQSGKTDYDPFKQIVTKGRYASAHWILRIDDNEFTDAAKRCFKPKDRA